MKIGVISDSHGSEKNILEVIKKFNNVDAIFHLGDFGKDIDLLKRYVDKVYYVLGNCDYMSEGVNELFLELEGVKILLTHGHKYGVKYTIDRLYYRALELKANLVVFGHTHIPMNIEVDGLQILNPGSITFPKGNLGKSYAIIDIIEDKIDVNIYELYN